ncbi:hypothetical protein [Photobacterium salinisoli]|uniref:hypothetical protein n=1 Tax=Photobacterium salinisoli TaxID=1616783 RepID=UPI000EA1B585|nr:hypothetical protein [Photobacterium salinisoli]
MKNDAFHSNDGEHHKDQLKAYSCKKTSDSAYTIASYLQLSEKDNKYDLYHWRVLLIKDEQRIDSSYSGFIEEETEIAVGDDPILLDTHEYYLDNNVKAFGVILNVGYTAPCSTGGRNQYFNLFVQNQNNMNRVLIDYPMQDWFILKGNTCYEDQRVIKQIVNSSVEVQETKTNGFFDLLVKRREIIENERDEVLDEQLKVIHRNKLLKFDGHFYR